MKALPHFVQLHQYSKPLSICSNSNAFMDYIIFFSV